MYDKKSLSVMSKTTEQHLIVRSDKSVVYRCAVLVKLLFKGNLLELQVTALKVTC